ncbi:D-alanyl-lipoteichoic acid biosynthesis protein DltD [Chitinimonas koreensis]|uniref:D-alanyl-lipoteichoic acid biosynthesis protein DltD n=1 Tax=Chitinimonas koreensis TaxID=356302 RepID=UPI0003F5260C|nr:D-alanyl-lipoteichoic acid biosynthesis protein DltD [Chitinimonas koreensis]QNM97363.1 hypothetical protein H9L41_03335 [Chitinimonas koreensis]
MEQAARLSAGWLYWPLLAAGSLLAALLSLAALAQWAPQRDEARYARHYTGYTGAESIPSLAQRLADGVPVVFGSSELSGDSPYLPQHYLPARLGQPVGAYGHAGMQLASIALALRMTASPAAYRNARIVVLVSPTWFDSGLGNEPEVIRNEVLSPLNLLRLCRAPAAGERNDVAAADAAAIDPAADAHWLARRCRDWPRLTAGLLDGEQAVGRLRTLLRDAGSEAPRPAPAGAVDWPAELAAAHGYEAARAHNAYGVDDHYFQTYLADQHLPRRKPALPAPASNRELRDLDALLAQLSHYRRKPLFVMLPLNPRVYSGLEHYRPTLDAADAAIRARGFGLYDLWAEPYRDGILRDPMHTGAAGWVMIAQRLSGHFGLPASPSGSTPP